MTTQKKIRFSAININHAHIYSQTEALLEAGAEMVSFFAKEPELATPYGSKYPQARQAKIPEEILEDKTIDLVITSGIPNERAPLGMRVMKAGKDFMSDKPGFTSLEQLAIARSVQAETGRIYSIYFSERLGNPATVKAGELVKQGAVGRVLQTVGLGPHRINPPSRPAWFFKKAQYGGILTDIASHQVDQFLFFTGSTKAEIIFSQVANYKYPEYPELEDFGEISLRGENCTGYIRVDWFTPDGLPTWGDGRLTILGAEGYIELRKYVDIAGKPGGDHLFLVDKTGMHYYDCKDVKCPYGRQLLSDITNRTETAVSQAHTFLASELALLAEQRATRLGYLRG
jgi:predicted dehydrogenase